MTTPVVPVPTAPPEAPASPAPLGAPSTSIADAIAQARARYAGGETIVPDEAPPLPHRAVIQPRAEDGTFAAETVDEPPAEEVPAEVPPVPGEDAAPEGESAAAEPPAPEGLTVRLPGRREGDPDLEIVVDDPAVAEALQRQRNGYLRAEQVRQEREALDRDRQERADFVAMVETDPIGFVAKSLPKDLQAETALYLLTQPEVWQLVEQDLHVLLQDEDKLELARAKLENKRITSRDQIAQRREQERAQQSAAEAVAQSVEKMTPANLSEMQQEVFRRDCLTDLARYARDRGLNGLSPYQMLDALAPRLEAYGLDPLQAAQSLRGAPAAPRASAPAPTPNRSTGQPPRSAPASPTPVATGQDPMQGTRNALKGIARRMNAAVVPAPGTTTPSSAAGAAPKGATVQQALESARARIAQGGGLLPQ